MVVGHTLVDASSWSASVLMVNPNDIMWKRLSSPVLHVWET